MSNMEDRVICLYDDYGDVYVKTNAPSDEIANAIAYKQDLLEQDKLYSSDFEAIQEYLDKKGFYFYETDFESFYW